MADQEMCVLRWKDVEHKSNFLFHTHVWHWVAYKGRKEIPENIFTTSARVSYSANIFTSINVCIKKLDKIKKDSYLQILTVLLKHNWKPEGFDIDDMATTFLRNN